MDSLGSVSLVALAAIGLVVGCSPKSAGRPPAVVVPKASGPELTDADMPHPKAGLWSTHSATIGDRQTCLSGQTLRYFSPSANCNQNSRRRSADGSFVMASQCSDGSHTATFAKGDFQSAFTVSFDGAATVNGDNGKMSDRIDYKYLGPCAAGQKPDDAR